MVVEGSNRKVWSERMLPCLTLRSYHVLVIEVTISGCEDKLKYTALKGFKLSQMSHAIIGMAQWSKLTRCTILDASSVKLLAVLIGPTNKGKGTVKSNVLSNFKVKGQNWDLNPGLHLLDKYFTVELYP